MENNSILLHLHQNLYNFLLNNTARFEPHDPTLKGFRLRDPYKNCTTAVKATETIYIEFNSASSLSYLEKVQIKLKDCKSIPGLPSCLFSSFLLSVAYLLLIIRIKGLQVLDGWTSQIQAIDNKYGKDGNKKGGRSKVTGT